MSELITDEQIIAAVGEPVELPFAILDQELKDLHRFHECVTDNEGYDVPKDRMKRLAEIGLVRRCSGNYYEHTVFGLSIINGDFSTTTKPLRERIIELEAEIARPGTEAKFKLGDRVKKTRGSCWTGKVVGTYSTELTPEGYAVESSTEHGSVQIYPASALELVHEVESPG